MTATTRRLVSARGRQRLVVAHRGASALHPENSRPAFQAAAEVADYIELDVRRTRDDHLVVFHDRTPRRTTNVREVWPERADDPIASFTRAELEQLDVGSWLGEDWRGEQMLQLDDVAALLAGTDCGMFVEIKDEDSIDLLVEQLRQIQTAWPDLRLAIGSIQPSSIEAAHRLLPDLPSGVLFLDEANLGTTLEDSRGFCTFACFRNDVVSPELVTSAHALGWQVTHNTNTRAAVRRCIEHTKSHGPIAGVDATTTDNPAIAVDPCTIDDIEAEALPVRASGGAEVVIRESRGVGYKYSGSADLCLIGAAGEWCELTIDLVSERTLTSVLLNCGPDGGVLRLDVDGVKITSGVDTARGSHCRSFLRPDLRLSPGAHTLRVQLEGPADGKRRAAIDVLGLSGSTS